MAAEWSGEETKFKPTKMAALETGGHQGDGMSLVLDIGDTLFKSD